MSDDGSAKAKKRRKAPLPDFRTIQYERPVAKKDFIKTNAANARRNIVMKKEPKRIFIRDNENNEEVIREEHFRRRSSVKPSVSSKALFWSRTSDFSCVPNPNLNSPVYLDKQKLENYTMSMYGVEKCRARNKDAK